METRGPGGGSKARILLVLLVASVALPDVARFLRAELDKALLQAK